MKIKFNALRNAIQNKKVKKVKGSISFTILGKRNTLTVSKNFWTTYSLLIKTSGKCTCCQKGSFDSLYITDNQTPGAAMIECHDGVAMTLDHDMLESMGGGMDKRNLNVLCYTCNYKRSNKYAMYKDFEYDFRNGLELRTTQNFSYTDVLRFNSNTANKTFIPVDELKDNYKNNTNKLFTSDMELKLVRKFSIHNDLINCIRNSLIQDVYNKTGVRFDLHSVQLHCSKNSTAHIFNNTVRNKHHQLLKNATKIKEQQVENHDVVPAMYKRIFSRIVELFKRKVYA